MIYIVMRDCCTSGNCTMCTKRTPFGKAIRVEQFRTDDKVLADKVAKNWRGYGATLKEVST